MRIMKKRRIVGLMSGTSLDGVDTAIVDVSGSGREIAFTLRHFQSRPYAAALHALLLENSAPETSSVMDISQLNVRLAHEYAAAVQDALAAAGLTASGIDAIGSHGQTVFHVPEPAGCAGEPVRSTLQLGDPSTLANLLGIPVVGDFRLADMAAGGQGAPLVPYFDYACFTSHTEHRLMLNIGGIANVTALPKDASPADVFAFDTGPGNMVIDALVRRFWDAAFDAGGRRAATGSVHPALLDHLLTDPYFDRPPPKSTGRELFSAAYVERLLATAAAHGVRRPEDVLATTAALTVEAIGRAVERFVAPVLPPDRVLVSGGGVHNAWLMRRLAERLRPAAVQSIAALGLDPDAKEAVCFAVLAHETLNGVPANIPRATGARQSVILGKICPVSTRQTT